MLFVVTPCSRPENLEKIAPTIPDFCQWIVLHEQSLSLPKIQNMTTIVCPKTGFVGADGRNYFLDNFILNDDDWIYSLDDDNIIHPDFYKIEKFLLEDFSLVHWGQLNKDNTVRLKPLSDIIIDTIDAACFISQWKYNKNVRYNTDVYNYDGFYAIDCAKNGPRLKLDMYLSYYNYLR